MSDTNKAMDEKENKRRKALKLPSLPKPPARKRFAEYSQSDIEENIRQQRESKKSKYGPEMLERYMESYRIGLIRRVEAAIIEKGGDLKSSDSIVIADKSNIKTVPIQNEGKLENKESESVVIADNSGIKFVPVKDFTVQASADMDAQDTAVSKRPESTRNKFRNFRRSVFATAFPTLAKIADGLEGDKSGDTFKQRLDTFQRDVFKTAFPTLAKVIDILERKRREDSKEKSREAIRDRRTLDRTESMAVSLESLSREQKKSVDLLRELLDNIRNMNGGRDGSGPTRSRLTGGLGRAARFAGRATPYVFAAATTAAVGYGAYTLMDRGTRSNEQAASEPPVNEVEPRQQERSRGQEFEPIDYRSLLRSEDGRFYIDNTEVPEEVYNNFRTLAEQNTEGMDSTQLDDRNRQILNIISNVQSGRATPVTQDVQSTPGSDLTASVDPEGSTETNNLARPISYKSDGASLLPKGPAVRAEATDVLSNEKAPVNDEFVAKRLVSTDNQNQLDPNSFAGSDLLLKAKKITFKGDEIEFISGDLATNKRTFSGVLPKTPTTTAPTPGVNQIPSEGGGTSTIGDEGQSTDTSNISFAPGVDPRIKKDIAQKVQQIEGVFGKKLLVTSGFRDQARNAAAGGARNSAHTRANAVDIQFSGNEQDTIKAIEAASAAGIGGIGVYRPGWLHLDTESKRVWGPDFSARSVPTWAKPALEAHMSGKGQQDAQAVATEESPPTAAGPDAAPSESNVGGGEGSGSDQLLSDAGGASAQTSMPTNGLQVASASQENAMAERTPVAPSVVIPETPTVGQASPGLSAPSIFNSPDDPGPVEPADAAERYAKLFNMAA